MDVHFMKSVCVENLEPQPGNCHPDFCAVSPQAAIGFARRLDDTLRDEFGKLVQLPVQGILLEQVVLAGIGLPGTALFAAAMLVKEFEPFGIDLHDNGRSASPEKRSITP